MHVVNELFEFDILIGRNAPLYDIVKYHFETGFFTKNPETFYDVTDILISFSWNQEHIPNMKIVKNLSPVVLDCTYSQCTGQGYTALVNGEIYMKRRGHHLLVNS